MTGIARIGDAIATNHGCTTSTTIITERENPTVFVDDIAVAIADDKTATHSYGGRNCSSTHQVTLINGSGSVFIGGKAVLRIDDITSGEKITGGSGTVFADD